MSKLPMKVLRGEKPTDEDWTEYLLEAHRRSPSQTPRTFASFRTSNGNNSYELLAHSMETTARPDAKIIDLACGDGFLIPFLLRGLGPQGRIVGIDMSESELAVAARSVTDSRISFHCAKAQALPVESATIDLVLCHMALMLMLPLEPVILELARVLKPKGRFSAIVGNRSAKRGLWEEIVNTSFGFADSRYAMIKETPTGDARVNTEAGLRTLFRPESGFGGIEELIDFELDIKTTPNGIWEFMRDMYFVGMLPEPDQQALARMLTALGERNQDSQAQVCFKFPMRKFTVSRI
jgi:SAM-dependent methyltransferase